MYPDEQEGIQEQPKRNRYKAKPVIENDRTNLVIWSLGTAILLGGITLVVVGAANGWEDGIKLGLIAFGLGMIAGAIAASVDFLPQNPHNYNKLGGYGEAMYGKTEENEDHLKYD